jgi:hypothetical protein
LSGNLQRVHSWIVTFRLNLASFLISDCFSRPDQRKYRSITIHAPTGLVE